MQTSETPDSAKAQQLVNRLQSHITENYYHCTNEILFGLGQMYVADERFRTNIDKHAEGAAAFIREAITGIVADNTSDHTDKSARCNLALFFIKW